MVFNTDRRLMQIKSIAECTKGSTLQYFRPSLSNYFPFRPLTRLFFVAAYDRFYCTSLIRYEPFLEKTIPVKCFVCAIRVLCWYLFCYALFCVLSIFAIILTSKRKNWLLCFNCLHDVLTLLVFCGSSSFVYSV